MLTYREKKVARRYLNAYVSIQVVSFRSARDCQTAKCAVIFLLFKMVCIRYLFIDIALPWLIGFYWGHLTPGLHMTIEGIC